MKTLHTLSLLFPRMRKICVLCVVILVGMHVLPHTSSPARANAPVTVSPIQVGEMFPPLQLTRPTSAADITYLGLRPEKRFSLRDVAADIVMVEILNTFCFSCQKQAPVFNELHTLIQSDTQLKSRVKLLGFHPIHLTKYGNVAWEPKEVEVFRKEVVGKYLAAPWSDNPDVPIVTSASITSSVILHNIAKGESLFLALKHQGLLDTNTTP